MKNRPEPSAEGPSPVGEEELILHFYGESPDPRAIDDALAGDPALAERYAELTRDLAAARFETPEPPSDLAARVWQEIRPQLAAPLAGRSWRERLGSLFAPAGGSLRGPRWTVATALIALLAAIGLGYAAGRREAPAPAREASLPTGEAAEGANGGGLSTGARERLLLASVETHLSGSERLLTRVTNAAPTDAAALAEESAWAEALVSSNRLYRRAAERSGQRRIVALLDELEPLLLELAHSEGAAPDDLAAAQRRIERTDLLFKLRVTGERLQRDAGASRATTKSDSRTVS
jgi:hypothetical protein